MAYGMLRSADVEIHLSPIVTRLAIAKLFIIIGVHITEEIPTRTCVTRHCVCLKMLCCPFGYVGKGSLSFRSGFITIHMRQLERKFFFAQWTGNPIFPNDREWLAPIALAREGSITHFIIYLSLTDAHLFYLFNHHFNCVPHQHTVNKITILQDRILRGVGFLTIILFANYIGDWNIEMFCKLVISFIATRHGHDGTGTITCQHIFGYPYWN